MNLEIRERWVAALRSGEYTQGTGMLRSNSGMYCCLGVLCDLALAEGVVTINVDGGGTSYIGLNAEEGIDDSDGYLPRAVVAWAGLGLRDPILTGERDGTVAVCASAWNDEFHATFEEIAEMIEASL